MDGIKQSNRIVYRICPPDGTALIWSSEHLHVHVLGN